MKFLQRVKYCTCREVTNSEAIIEIFSLSKLHWRHNYILH